MNNYRGDQHRSREHIPEGKLSPLTYEDTGKCRVSYEDENFDKIEFDKTLEPDMPALDAEATVHPPHTMGSRDRYCETCQQPFTPAVATQHECTSCMIRPSSCRYSKPKSKSRALPKLGRVMTLADYNAIKTDSTSTASKTSKPPYTLHKKVCTKCQREYMPTGRSQKVCWDCQGWQPPMERRKGVPIEKSEFKSTPASASAIDDAIALLVSSGSEKVQFVKNGYVITVEKELQC